MSAVVVLAASVFAVLEKGKLSGAVVGLSVSYALQVGQIYSHVLAQLKDSLCLTSNENSLR